MGDEERVALPIVPRLKSLGGWGRGWVEIERLYLGEEGEVPSR
jgi:hypothetical protein